MLYKGVVVKLKQIARQKAERKYFRIIISVIWLVITILTCSLVIHTGSNPPDVSYYDEEYQTYAYPLNIGFHPESIIAMIATIILGISIYTVLKKSKDNLLIAMTCTFILLNFNGYQCVYKASYYQLYEFLTGDYDFGIKSNFKYLWNGYLLIAFFIALIIYGAVISRRKTESDGKRLKLFYFAITLINILSAIQLYIRSFSNMWFIYECIVTSVFIILSLLVVDKLRVVTNYEKKWKSSYSMIELLMNSINKWKWFSYDPGDFDLDDYYYEEDSDFAPARYEGWSVYKNVEDGDDNQSGDK